MLRKSLTGAFMFIGNEESVVINLKQSYEHIIQMDWFCGVAETETHIIIQRWQLQMAIQNLVIYQENNPIFGPYDLRFESMMEHGIQLLFVVKNGQATYRLMDPLLNVVYHGQEPSYLQLVQKYGWVSIEFELKRSIYTH